MEATHIGQHHGAWNKGKLVGQKAPFKLKEIWAIRVRLELQGRLRELAFFDLGIDNKPFKEAGLNPDDYLFPSRFIHRRT